jgi:hypothetical protein
MDWRAAPQLNNALDWLAGVQQNMVRQIIVVRLKQGMKSE